MQQQKEAIKQKMRETLARAVTHNKEVKSMKQASLSSDPSTAAAACLRMKQLSLAGALLSRDYTVLHHELKELGPDTLLQQFAAWWLGESDSGDTGVPAEEEATEGKAAPPTPPPVERCTAQRSAEAQLELLPDAPVAPLLLRRRAGAGRGAGDGLRV